MKISETTLNCCKPNRYISFAGEEDNNSSQKKVRYKHYEQMSDDVLVLRSILKAHDEVQKSNKMRFLKALPAITTTLIGTTIALTQPGKLASKAAAGLGFLALSKAFDVAAGKITERKQNQDNNNNNNNNNNKETDNKKTIKTIGKIALGVGAIALSVFALKNTKILNFAKQESNQLAKEINNTKLGKFVENKMLPFAAKHPKTINTIGNLAPLGIICTSCLTQLKLADSLVNDLKEKTANNFAKGKLIQAQARAHYDSIDAQEI